MPPLPTLINQYIVRTDIKVNKSNVQTFCKPCIEELREEEGCKIWFPNKKDRIIQYFKKCSNFFTKTKEEEREEIFALLHLNNDNNTPNLVPQKRTSSGSSLKIINRSSYYGPMDNYIVRSLSKEDLQKFYMLLFRLTVSCRWALSWVNNSEAKELFDFLNPFLKLPDRRVLGGDILKQVVDDADKAMETALKEDQIGIMLTFDGWVNVKNEQLLGTVLLSYERKPYLWKAVDISSEHENYTTVMDKIEIMLTDLKKKDITVCAIVTDSTPAYAAARLLKTQQVLQILAINFKPPIVETRHRQGEAPTLPHKIFETIDSSIFWNQITLINEILELYCKILNMLQCDKARLFQVVHNMNYLVQFWLNRSDDALATKLIDRLEKRWKD
ncbi:uncharacterized protein OCT59_026273 [Rhizophagus irregularis]|uniref:uncharacterized protein n=1 Tax=Rhizophagus irregularis TaxID=588596 RepID=UPI00331FF050|nr:hypothetical protein OCT59_026273 [Rhizophagus irregularis]